MPPMNCTVNAIGVYIFGGEMSLDEFVGNKYIFICLRVQMLIQNVNYVW